MDELVAQFRTDLLTHMAEFVREMQMPLHLTGDALTAPEELGKLQEIFRRYLEHRSRLGESAHLFSCAGCGHFEGEHHASDCTRYGRSAAIITRPPGWMWDAVGSGPVEIFDMAPLPCPVAGCIYCQISGIGFCAQHRPKGS